LTDTAKPSLRQVLANPKMIAILVLGASSGFPNQITESTLWAWLKDAGVSNTTIGLVSYVALPYMLKFLWAPLIDRYALPFLGRRRGWILAMQLAIAGTIALFALQDPTQSLTSIVICATAIVFFSATQDIAYDAYRIDISQPHERGLVAAANNLGYRTSSWLAFAAALVVADTFGWRVALLMLAALMLAFTLATWLTPEPEYIQKPPRTLRESVTEPLKALLTGPGALAMIGLILLFKIGDAFALKLFTPFLMDVGFSKTEIGVIAKAVLTSSAIVGAVLGGIWMIKLGLLRSMLLFGVMQAVSNLAYYILAVVGKNYAVMITAVAIDNLAGAMGNIAVVALIMALCDVRFSAFQYALLSTLALLPRYSLGGPAGWLSDYAGWDVYYITSFFIGLPGLLLVWLLRERIARLDQGSLLK
jgi:MFS transporter, PAT family, beta-lactamase induction signal transducer AmpG